MGQWLVLMTNADGWANGKRKFVSGGLFHLLFHGTWRIMRRGA